MTNDFLNDCREKYTRLIREVLDENPFYIDCSVNYRGEKYKMTLSGIAIKRIGALYAGIYHEIFDQEFNNRVRKQKLYHLLNPDVLKGKYRFEVRQNKYSYYMYAANRKEAIEIATGMGLILKKRFVAKKFVV